MRKSTVPSFPVDADWMFVPCPLALSLSLLCLAALDPGSCIQGEGKRGSIRQRLAFLIKLPGVPHSLSHSLHSAF